MSQSAIIIPIGGKATQWEPGDGPRNALECSRILIECTQQAKLLRVSQSECHKWMGSTGERVDHPDNAKHMTHSTTSTEKKCSLTLAELTQLAMDSGASRKVAMALCSALRKQGVGEQVESHRWVWVKNEGSQSKSK